MKPSSDGRLECHAGAMSPPAVVIDDSTHRFVVATPHGDAFIQFRRRADRLVLVHTEVPSELEGQGLATTLVEAALAHAEEHHLTVVPVCPMVKGWLHRHPDATERLTIDWLQDTDD